MPGLSLILRLNIQLKGGSPIKAMLSYFYLAIQVNINVIITYLVMAKKIHNASVDLCR